MPWSAPFAILFSTWSNKIWTSSVVLKILMQQMAETGSEMGCEHKYWKIWVPCKAANFVTSWASPWTLKQGFIERLITFCDIVTVIYEHRCLPVTSKNEPCHEWCWLCSFSPSGRSVVTRLYCRGFNQRECRSLGGKDGPVVWTANTHSFWWSEVGCVLHCLQTCIKICIVGL